MTLNTWVLYIGTLFVFMATPGPSHLLMLSVSMANGFRRSLATASGDLTANAIQIALAGSGLAAIVTVSRYGFAIVKWAGVAYLVWIGVRQIMASFKNTTGSERTATATARQLWLRGFITSAANPKAVVFFAALFPQFIDPTATLLPQILILGGTYLIIDGLFLSGYGKGAAWIAARLRTGYRPWLDRAAGGGLIAAAVLLGMRTADR